jgi:dTDP-4-dehydrorhamnose 3,5-epimerase
MSYSFTKLGIPDVLIIEPQVFPDNRGKFFEIYKESIFKENGFNSSFVQDNYSHSTRNVLRGLHFQKSPMAQAKLVTVLKGKIFDVAVDIRKNSPTYGQWIGETLSEDNHKLIYVPEGFAHGFCVLSSEASVFYKVTNEYSNELEQSILWNDPQIGISWPITEPIMSKKDLEAPLLKNIDNDFVF